MKENLKRNNRTKTLREFRKIHRTTGILLLVFFLITSVTGLLLGWKKHSGDLIQSKSYKGTSTELNEWLSVDSLHTIACRVLKDSISPVLSTEIDRIEIRKNNGMVKFTFKEHFWGIQLDGASGRLLHIERRRSDIIEHIHDGSILDYYFGTSSGILKLIYTTIMGLSLLIFIITGFWLWYGPKRISR